MKINNQSGFTVVEGLLILVIVGVLGFTGWYVMNSKKNVDKTNQQTVAASQSKTIATVDNTKYWDCFAKAVADKPSAVVNVQDNSCSVCIDGVQTDKNKCVKKSVTISMPKAYTPESIIGFSKLPNEAVPTVDRIAKQNHDISYPSGGCSGNEPPAYVQVVTVADNSKLVKLELYPKCGDPTEALVYNDNGTWVEGVGAGAPASYQCSFLNKYKIPYSVIFHTPAGTKPGCRTADGKYVDVSY